MQNGNGVEVHGLRPLRVSLGLKLMLRHREITILNEFVKGGRPGRGWRSPERVE